MPLDPDGAQGCPYGTSISGEEQFAGGGKELRGSVQDLEAMKVIGVLEAFEDFRTWT